MKIAVFDIDGTLYSANSSNAFMDYFLKDNKNYRWFKQVYSSIIARGINSFLLKYVHVDPAKYCLVRFLNGRKVLTVDAAARAFIKEILRNCENREVIELLNHLRGEGYMIVLASSSYEFLVKQIAEELSAENYISSTLHIVGNTYIGKYLKDVTGKKKEVFQNEYSEYEQLIVVTDNRSDVGLLKSADKCYIVCNDKTRKYWIGKKLTDIEFISVG